MTATTATQARSPASDVALVIAAGFAIAGLLVPVVLGRSREERLGALLAAVPATALGGLGFATSSG